MKRGHRGGVIWLCLLLAALFLKTEIQAKEIEASSIHKWNNDGLLMVKKDGKFGYVNQNGDWVIPPVYRAHGKYYLRSYAEKPSLIDFDFEHGIVILAEEDRILKAINKDGRMIATGEDYLFLDNVGGALLLKEKGKRKYGIINKEGEIKVPFIYTDFLRTEGTALIAANADGKYGVISPHGRRLMPFRFHQIADYADGMAIVRDKKGRYGLYSAMHGKIIPFGRFDRILRVKNGAALVKKGKKYALVGARGNFLVKPGVFQTLEVTGRGFAGADKKGRVHLLDKKGKKIRIFKKGLTLEGGVGGLIHISGRWGTGLIDSKGKKIVPFGKFVSIKTYREGAIVAKDKKERLSLLNFKGKELVPSGIYDGLDFINGRAVVRNFRRNYGVINTKGEILVPFGSYSSILSATKKGMVVFQSSADVKERKLSILDAKGRTVGKIKLLKPEEADKTALGEKETQ